MLNSKQLKEQLNDNELTIYQRQMEVQTIDGLYTRLITLIKQLQCKPNDAEALKQEKIALHQLYFIFGNQMRKALMFLDQKIVAKYACNMMQQSVPLTSIYKVSDPEKAVLVFISENGAKFCNCDYFIKNIVEDQNSIICPHILSALLAEAYAEYSIIQVNLSQYLNLSASCC